MHTPKIDITISQAYLQRNQLTELFLDRKLRVTLLLLKINCANANSNYNLISFMQRKLKMQSSLVFLHKKLSSSKTLILCKCNQEQGWQHHYKHSSTNQKAKQITY